MKFFRIDHLAADDADKIPDLMSGGTTGPGLVARFERSKEVINSEGGCGAAYTQSQGEQVSNRLQLRFITIGIARLLNAGGLCPHHHFPVPHRQQTCDQRDSLRV